jgi:hypothetical protein
MKGDIAARVLTTASRRGFNSLISEWERSGFLSQIVAGLSMRDAVCFQESARTVRILIEFGVTRALAHFLIVYPDIKIRLRLARLFAESSSFRARAELGAAIKNPMCHRLVAAKIAKLISEVGGGPTDRDIRQKGNVA